MNKLIVAAFETVATIPALRHKWIIDDDFVKAIRQAYDLPPERTLNSQSLNMALARDIRYSSADNKEGNGRGTYIWKHWWEDLGRTCRFYYVTDEKGTPPTDAWIKSVVRVSLGDSTVCGVDLESRQKLLKVLPVLPPDPPPNPPPNNLPCTPESTSPARQSSLRAHTPTMRQLGNIQQPSQQMDTPTTAGVKIVNPPRPARKHLDDNQDGKAQPRWGEPTDEAMPSQRSVNRYATNLEKTLIVQSKNNPQVAQLIVKALSKKFDSSITDPNVACTKNPIDHIIVDGIRSFIHDSWTSGEKTEKNRQLVDVIASAALWNTNSPTSQIAKRLGLSEKRLLEKRKRVDELKANKGSFEPKRRKIRKDCIAADATACVWNWCHTKDASLLDTESKQQYSVRDPTTGVKTKHPQRTWKDAPQRQRFAVFLESDDYANFQINHPAGTIGRERFRTSVCSCCREA